MASSFSFTLDDWIELNRLRSERRDRAYWAQQAYFYELALMGELDNYRCPPRGSFDQEWDRTQDFLTRGNWND
jgi:hypothetical protein